MTAKESVLKAVREMPGEATWEEIVDHLDVLAAIRRADKDAEAGHVYTHEEVKQEIATWFSK